MQLVFLGEVLPGFQLDDVKRSLGQLLKLDEPRLAHLFSGGRAVLKRSLPAHEAQRYVDHLARHGARIRIEPVPPPPMPPLPTIDAGPEPAPVPPRAAAAVAKPVPAVPAPTPAPTPAPATTPAPVPAPALALVPSELDVAPGDEEIVCPNCGERQPKRILCRACATNMPMGIAAKLEADQQAKEERLAEIRARRGLRPDGSSLRAEETVGPPIFGFGFSGRLSRLPYATANIVVMTVLYLLTVYALSKPSVGRIVFVVLASLAMFLQSMRLTVLRCHDCDRHGWWSLFVFVPYAGSIAGLLLSFLPGTDGDNDFGPPPTRGGWRWLLLAFLVMFLAIGLSFRTMASIAERGMSQRQQQQQEQETSDDEDEAAAMLPSDEAGWAFHNDYEPARSPKAFAVSPSGSWGWKSGGAMQDVLRGALAECEARRKAYTAPCQLVNVNGQWAPRK